MDISKKERCYFNFTYTVDGFGINDGDYEFNPFLVTWGTYESSTGENYDIAKTDQMEFTKSYIKEGLKKGEKTKAGKKVKKLYKKGKKGYKKTKKQIQEEKKGIKEYRDEKKKHKEEKRAKEKAEKDKKTKKKPLPTPKKKTTSSFYLGKDYDSKSGSEESTKSTDDETSEEDSEDQSSEDTESSEEEETTTKSSFFNALDTEQEESISKEIKCYKESKPVGNFELPYSNKMRGDEHLWLKLEVHTSHSGQESIDKKESPFHKRIQQAGVRQIPINLLIEEISDFQNEKPLRPNVKIQAINESEILLNYETSFYMPKAGNIKTVELKEQNPNLSDKEINEFVLKLCTKAKINIQFHVFNVSKQLIKSTMTTLSTILNFYNKLDATKFMSLMTKQQPLYLTNGKEIEKQPIFIPFDHALHAEILGKSMGYFIGNYKKAMYTGPDSVPFYKPFNKQVENLHLAYYSTEQGDLPVINYMIRKKKTEFTDDSEKYFLIQLSASLKRNGLGIDNFISIVNQQFERKDDKIIHNFINCVDAVNNIGTFAATQILYTSDFRYLNDLYVKKGTQVNMDSWDTDVSAGYGSSDDCEGMGSIAIEILSYIKKGQLLDKKTKTYGWNSPALETARKILCNRITSGIASTVTEAFVDTQGQKISNKKVTNLPMVGDKIDLNSPVGGHFFGISTPNAIIAKQLKNSPDFKNYNSAIKEFVNKTYYPWEYNQSILILEGTAMIKSDILPPEESFKNNKVELKKNESLRKMFKFIRENSKPEDGDGISHSKEYKLTLFNSIMSPEGLPFYFEKQDPNRRISKFYKDAVHFISTELYEMDETFSHLIYGYKKDNTFGCNIGDILRDLGNKDSNIMLARPLIDIKDQTAKFARTLWSNAILPLMDTVIRQQPESIIGNYTPEQTTHLISQKIFNDIPELKIENSDIKNHMFLKGTEKVINITNNQAVSYIINGKENPVLLLNQGTHYKLKINSPNHPFWVLQKQGNEYIPFKGIIKNNGTDNGNIKIFIPCDQDVSNLIYMCEHHDKMTGSIGIKKTLECSAKGDEMPEIDYKYKKPSWHFDTDISKVAENDNLVVMKWFSRRFNFDNNPKVLPQIKNQLEFLKGNGLVDYAFFEQKYFPQCESVVELLMVLDVNKIK
jgi:hypothetical protein